MFNLNYTCLYFHFFRVRERALRSNLAKDYMLTRKLQSVIILNRIDE